MEQALVEMAQFPPEASLDAVFRRVCELSAEALQVERVGVWLFIDECTVLRCANLFERSQAAHSSGAVLRVSDFPNYFASLKLRKAVPSSIAASEPWTSELTAEYLQPLGIASMLDAGIFVNGELTGVICHEHVGEPRDWGLAARAFAGSMADRLALRIQSAEVRDLRAAFQTQQKRLAAHARIAAMEKLTAGIAHDLKNLLTTFRIYGKLLSQRADLPEDAREQAHQIYAATERGAVLAKELMDFARPAFAPPTVLDLGAATGEFLETLLKAIGPRYDLQYAGSASLGRVLVEKAQYQRLLLNVTANAAEAMPEGGTIRIRVASVRGTGKRGRAGQFVMLEVADSGGGMDETTQQRLFEPYFTTKPKGTGLGMPIVWQIVDYVGGFIRVESALGQGTTVRMYFPAIRAGGDAERERRSAAQRR
jgi:signal transduction histidine kinase